MWGTSSRGGILKVDHLPLSSPPPLPPGTPLNSLQKLQFLLSQGSHVCKVLATLMWAVMHVSSPSHKSVRSQLCCFWTKAIPSISLCRHTQPLSFEQQIRIFLQTFIPGDEKFIFLALCSPAAPRMGPVSLECFPENCR